MSLLNIRVTRHHKNATCELSGKVGECITIDASPLFHQTTVCIPEFLKLTRAIQESTERNNGHTNGVSRTVSEGWSETVGESRTHS